MRFTPLRPGARVAICSLAAATLMWLPAFRDPLATGFGDWQYFHHLWEAGFVALTRYREWPLWDPFHCGGIPIFANPQSQHLSPLYLFVLLVGPTLSTKFFIVLHAWAGFAGMYLLARRQLLSMPAAALSSLTWCASGFFVWHLATGHAAFCPFYVAPWVILAVRKTVRDIRYAPALAALLTLVLLEGGVYPFPYFLLLVGFTALVQSPWGGPRFLQGVAGLLVAGILTALMGAVRLWPIIDELRRHPRIMQSSDGVSLLEIVEMLTARDHTWLWPSHGFLWAEYGSYLGTGVCALAILGIFPAWRRGGRWVLGGALVFLAFTLGDHGPASPWAWLRALPIFDSLRVPSRFTVLFCLYLTLLSGYGLDAILQLAERQGFGRRAPARRLLAGALLFAVAVNLAMVQYPVIDRWRRPPVRTDSVSPRFYLTDLPYHVFLASFPRMNLGTRHCYSEATSFKPARGFWVGDKPQVRIVRGRGKVSAFRRTTSRAFFEARLREPSRIVVNQNYAPGWRANVGRVDSDKGRLALELPAGTYSVAFVYRPLMLWPSVTLGLIGLVLALIVARFGRLILRAI